LDEKIKNYNKAFQSLVNTKTYLNIGQI